MKKVLVGLLMVIPLIIVGAVLLITEVVLLTPDIFVSGVEIVDEYQVPQNYVVIENFRDSVTHQLFAKVTPQKANNRAVRWSIDEKTVELSNPEYIGDIATVSTDGLVTIHSTGRFDVVLTSDDGGYTARCTFEVKGAVATSAFIVKDGVKSTDFYGSMTMTTDEIIKLDACARPTDAKIEYIYWSSSDVSVLTVDANGVIVPKKAGKADITIRLKSFDGKDKAGNVIVANELTDTVTVTITGGVFAVSAYNLCVEPRYDADSNLIAETVSLESLGATGATLDVVQSVDCRIEGGNVVFTNITGKAVLVKGDKSIIVRRYRKNAIVFENADQIGGSTIIIGKIPFALKCVSAETGAAVEGVRYSSSNSAVADINPTTGKVTAQSEGEVTFTATAGSEKCYISFSIREPVVFFSITQDTYLGIAQERIYGTKWCVSDSDTTLTNTRAPLTIVPQQGKEFLNTDFIWSIDNDDVASIDENGAITVNDFEGSRTITVTASAIDSPYACDRIQRTYSFTVMTGVNVTNATQILAVADAKEYNIFMQSDIMFVNSNESWQIRVYTDLYGNGQVLNWRHLDGGEKNISGADILEMHKENGLLRNIHIKSSWLPDDGSMTSRSFSRKCLETYGNNMLVQYCQLENAQYCSQASSNVTYEGCVFSNSSKFALFCWAVRVDQKVTVKNCIFGQSAAPSIGFSAGNDDPANSCTLNFEGFCYIYNWKQDMDMDLIGEITHDAAIDGAIKNVVNTELKGSRYNEFFYTMGGVKYMHCGMLLSGFQHKCNIILTGNVEGNGFNQFVVDFAEVGGGSLKNILPEGALFNCYIYGYYGDEIPILPTDKLTLNDATFKLLREGVAEE